MSASVRYHVRHETRYAYDGIVAHAHQLLHLSPRATQRQRCHGYSIEVQPAPALRRAYTDAFGNEVTRLELDRPHESLEVIAAMDVQIAALPSLDAAASNPWDDVVPELRYQAATAQPAPTLEAQCYAYQSPYVSLKSVYAHFAQDCFAPRAPLLRGAEALMAKIHGEFTYAPGATHIATPLAEVYAQRRGVCQDYAHFMIACLRSLGLAARYVSGYLRTLRPDGETAVGTDASHAWVSVYAPPFGWVDLDPTNNQRCDREHVVLAWGRDFGDVSPLRGVILGGGAHEPSVAVAVTPVPL